jgi:catechol 2,3-dioxygenase-like lactoylglutathione lyase family enzyme
MATVRYIVNDVEEAIKFYTEMLDFMLDEKMGAAFARVSKDGLTLWLAGPQSSAARPMPDGRKPEAGGWNRFVIEVDDIQAMVEKMRLNGMKFRNDIVTGPGGKQILVEDPSGNPIELFQSAQ